MNIRPSCILRREQIIAGSGARGVPKLRYLIRLYTVFVEENDSVEFLLYLWKSTEPFYALCLLAALRAKQCAPQKVTLTLVADRLELEQRLALRAASRHKA